jgi:hypothetical protein
VASTGVGQQRGVARRRRCTCALMPAWASSSITGPTSVASSAGSPTRSSAIAPRASRSRRRRCPRARTAGAAPSSAGRPSGRRSAPRVDHLLGQRRAVDDHRVQAAGLGDQRHDGAVLGRQRADDQMRATAVLPVNTRRRCAGRPPAARPPSRRGRAAVAARRRHAGLVQQATKRCATSGVCSAGLAATVLPATSAATTWPAKIASGKFHGLMQTNTPRPCRRSSLLSPVGPGRAGRPGAARPGRRSSGRSRPPRAPRPRVAQVLPASDQQAAELGSRASSGRRRGAARRRARPPAPARPGGTRACRRCHGRVATWAAWPSPPRAAGTAHAPAAGRAAPAGQVHARELARPRRTAPPAAAGPGGRRHAAARQQRVGADTVVGQLVHEGRVGAVLQQPAHQVGQQVAVFAHRGVDAAAARRAAHHLAVDAFAHAVQALHLERRRAAAGAICTMAAMVPALWVANCG